jgi:hypothetical protein
MKMRVFALTGAAALVLAACGGNQDTVENAELNQPEADLNQLSSDAANDAANMEAAALGNQLDELNQANADETENPADADEQNVSGM